MPDLTARDRFAAAAQTTPCRFQAATTGRAATVHMYGVIGASWGGLDPAEIVPQLRALDVDEITVHVNSPGGDVYDGMALYNALRAHPARVTAIIDGLAASAASVIICAADDVAISPGAEVMIHDAWSLAIGDADALRKEADSLDRISENVAGIYAARAGGTTDHWRDLMRAETWFSASEAVTAGLADRIDGDAAEHRPAAAAVFDLSMYAHPGRAAAAASNPARKDTPMPDTLTRDDLDAALQEAEQRQNRAFEVRLSQIATATPDAGPSWPTMGAFIKDLVGGSEAAMSFYERLTAYTGSTTADDKQPNTWVKSAIHLIQRTRKILGAFTTEPLPDEGMSLEYLQLKTNSVAVAKQTAEGDDLAKGKIQLKSASAPVETYGGWTELSRQQIDRGSAAYVSTANTAMTLEYARATEQVIRDLLKGIIAAQIAGAPALTIAANANAYAWLDLIVDAAGLFDDLGYTLDGGFVSKDVFKKLIRLEDTNGNSLMRVWGTGMNQVGELDLRQIEGELASVQFRILPGATANTVEFHDRIGITTWESPGAPFRLQDQNVVNLTEAMSQYGYLAAASQFPDAIQAVKVTGV